MIESSALPIPSVSLVDGRPATTSLAIAEHFGKSHFNVMRDIRELIGQGPEEFSQFNFELAEYMDDQGKMRPMYTVFFDGFKLLVMGYTGPAALAMKLAYIKAFNAMRERLDLLAGEEASENFDRLVAERAVQLASLILEEERRELCKSLDAIEAGFSSLRKCLLGPGNPRTSGGERPSPRSGRRWRDFERFALANPEFFSEYRTVAEIQGQGYAEAANRISFGIWLTKLGFPCEGGRAAKRYLIDLSGVEQRKSGNFSVKRERA